MALPFFLAATACQSSPAAPTPEPPAPPTVTASAGPVNETAPPGAMAPASTPHHVSADEPLREGLVELEGIVRPTKGGLDVRGVTFSLEALQRALNDDSMSHGDLLGTKLRVVAELEAHESHPRAPGEPAIQTRGGRWFEPRELHAATIVAPAVMIEGEVSPSKGLLSVGEHMVTRADLSWSLVGVDPIGKRVRLWGQPRVHVCHPQAQCLVGGKIPMFDVARAELVE